MTLVQIYLSSMYGSNLWDLFDCHAEKLYISWNVLIRTTFKLHFATHRYIVYNLTKIPHIRISLLKRFVCLSMPIDINENDKWILPFLKELLNVRDGTSETNLSALEINDIIDYLCTN